MRAVRNEYRVINRSRPRLLSAARTLLAAVLVVAGAAAVFAAEVPDFAQMLLYINRESDAGEVTAPLGDSQPEPVSPAAPPVSAASEDSPAPAIVQNQSVRSGKQPDSAMPALNRHLAHRDGVRLTQEVRMLRLALARCYHQVGVLHAQQRRFPEAFAAYENAVRYDRRTAEYCYYAGMTAAVIQHADAADYLRRYLQLSPQGQFREQAQAALRLLAP